jgi:hypothetical protein
MKASREAAPTRCWDPGQAVVWEPLAGLAQERGERHENMYVTMLETGHLGL